MTTILTKKMNLKTCLVMLEVDVINDKPEEEEEEGDFKWKCRLLEVIQQYPEVYDLAHPRYKDKDM